jgi:protein-L-isoaspartate(D-aspartate) O-methyltransferase
MSLSTATSFERQRFNMVEQQVRTWDVLDYRVLDVLHQVPRELFVKAEHQNMAYADTELPVPNTAGGQILFKPIIDGRILQALGLTGEESVLEIGTGSGYTTACLAKLARQVTSIEIDAALTAQAQSTLKKLDIYNAKVIAGDALANLATLCAGQKFDAIVLGGAVIDVPAKLSEFLQPTGRIFAVRGLSPVLEAVLIEKGVIKSLFETDLPYLQGAEPKKKFVF